MTISALRSRISLFLLVLVIFTAIPVAAQEKAKKEKSEMTIQAGNSVSLEYTLSVEGEKLESNIGKDPLVYTHGQKQIIPGLESELSGLKVGDTKTIPVSPEKGYGQVSEKSFLEVPITQVPEDARKPGAVLSSRDPEGNPIRAVVKEVKGANVVLDFNHPLAGKTLVFDIKVLSIN